MENEDKFKEGAELGGSKVCMVKWCLFLFGAFWFVSGVGEGDWSIYRRYS